MAGLSSGRTFNLILKRKQRGLFWKSKKTRARVMFSDYWTTNKTYFELNGSVPQQDQTGVTLDGLRLNYSDELNFIGQRRSLSKVKSFSISLYNLTEHLWGSLLSAVFEKISEHAIDLQGKKKKIIVWRSIFRHQVLWGYSSKEKNYMLIFCPYQTAIRKVEKDFQCLTPDMSKINGEKKK